MAEQLINQIRRVINERLERERKKLELSELASTALATAQLNDAPLKVQVFVYNDEDASDENTFEWEVHTLDDVWERIFKEPKVKKAKPDDVDVQYAPFAGTGEEDTTYPFESEDVEVAYNRAKGYV